MPKMRTASSVSAKMMAALSVLYVTATQLPHVSASSRHHGGVPMGHINVCDDAKTQIAIDWDPRSSEEYTCDTDLPQGGGRSEITCEKETDDPIHVCYPAAIQYNKIPPTSGRHRPNWADYGEYTYVPPQRWLHDLEHGAIVMLYHPCADPREVDALRQTVTGCIRKHIITPYKLLPYATPFALLSWGCKLVMGHVDVARARQFIKDHGKVDGPEGILAKPGRYNVSRIVPARVVSDFDDSFLCPHSPIQENGPWGPGADIDDVSFLDDMYGILPVPFARRRNPIIVQSVRRRRMLNGKAEQLQRSLQRMQQAFERLVGQ